MSPQPGSFDSPPGPEITLDGRRYLYFGGTSYLGLHAHPEVLASARDAIQRYGIHTATSRTGVGESPTLRDLEREAAHFFGTEAALSTTSGWTSPAVLCDALKDRLDYALLDTAAHYAIQDAVVRIGIPIERYAHADADDALRLANAHTGRPLLATDGVFASTGHVAPVADLADIARTHGGALLVDDAHGFGVLGAHGRGTVEHAGIAPTDLNDVGAPVFVCGTLSKALGGFGGIVPGTASFIADLRERSPLFAGASASPAPIAAAAARALRIAEAHPELREALAANVRRVRAGLRALGLEPATDLPTPIVALDLGAAERHQELSDALREDGILVPYMPRYAGTGPAGALRIAVFANHEPTHLDQLLQALRRRV